MKIPKPVKTIPNANKHTQVKEDSIINRIAPIVPIRPDLTFTPMNMITNAITMNNTNIKKV